MLRLSNYVKPDERVFLLQCLQNKVITLDEARGMLFFVTGYEGTPTEPPSLEVPEV